MISEVIQEQYLCSICELPFLSRKLVNRHSLSAHKKKIYIVQHYCTRCPNYYQSKEDLNHHFQIAHVEKCTKCPQSFQSKGELNYHYEQTHTVPCSKCPKRFSSKDLLKTHFEINHFAKCTKCPLKFGTMGQFNHHFQVAHTDMGTDMGKLIF